MWKVNNTLLNDQWFKEEITRKVRKYFYRNENKNPIYQNWLDTSETILRGKYIVVIDNVVKEKKISNQQCNLPPQETGSRAN